METDKNKQTYEGFVRVTKIASAVIFIVIFGLMAILAL